MCYSGKYQTLFIVAQAMASMMFLNLNLHLIFVGKNRSQQLPLENETVRRPGRASASFSEESYSVSAIPTQRRPVEKCYSRVKFKGEINSISSKNT